VFDKVAKNSTRVHVEVGPGHQKLT